MATEQAYNDYKNSKIIEKNGKFYIGDYPSAYSSKEEAEAAYKAMDLLTF